jgi:hypothetical protein
MTVSLVFPPAPAPQVMATHGAACPAKSTVGFHPIANAPLFRLCSTHETKCIFPASNSKTARRNVSGAEAGLNQEKASK